MLNRDPKERLGGFKDEGKILTQNGSVILDDADELRAHPFFAGLDWDAIRIRDHTAPYVPPVMNDLDTSCIDSAFTEMHCSETPEEESPLKTHFDGFTFDNKDKSLLSNF